MKGNPIRRTELYLVTFDRCTIPSEVKIGWTKLKVREYIPKPRRCFQCQRWGHGAASCRERNAVCMNCADDFHGKECNRPPKCANCNEQRPAASRDCFYYRLEEETLHIKYKEKLSYREAKEKATERFIKPGTTYSSIVRKQINPAERTQPLKSREAPVAASSTKSLITNCNAASKDYSNRPCKRSR